MLPFYKPTPERILSRDTVRELDQTAIDRLGIPGLVLMENAARAVAQWILTEWENPEKWSKVLIFCGIGNNAGDGLAVARHLQLHGIDFQIFLCANPERFRGDARFQYELAQKLDLPMTELYTETEKEGVFRVISEHLSENSQKNTLSTFYLVDALLGTGAIGVPRFPMNAVISWMNTQVTRGSRLLAIDVPTGLDCETGLPFDGEENVARADITLTLAAAKPGLVTENAQKFVGDLWISDIGVSVEKIREA